MKTGSKLGILIGLCACTSLAQADGHPMGTPQPAKRFPLSHVSSASESAVRPLLANDPVAASALKAASQSHLSDNLHLLMPAGPDVYQRVVITPEHVLMERHDGIIDVVKRSDAEAQIQSGQNIPTEKIEVGLLPRMVPLFAEHGPAGTVRLYRELPVNAKGEIASSDFNTSFALDGKDALHPFGSAGRKVSISVPRSFFDRAANGEIGGAGWLESGMNYPIDTPSELQINSGHLRNLLNEKHSPAALSK